MLLSDLVARLGLEFHGTDLEVSGVNTLEAAGPAELSFFANPKYKEQLQKSRAGAVILDKEHASLIENPVVSSSPYLDFVRAVQFFDRDQDVFQGQSGLAFIDPTAEVDSSVCVHPFVYIGPGARVGAGSRIFSGSYIGENCVIGENCLLYPRVVLMADTVIGKNVIIHPGAVLGSDGFGFARSGQKSVKFPQLGYVVVGDDVEIGANTTIDRAALGQTRVGHGCKIDNLVQLAHNVQVGENSMLAAQVGIAGSTKMGKEVVLGGQVGISGHLEIGDGCQFGAKAGVIQCVPPGQTLTGYPALNHQTWLKSSVIQSRLPELVKRIRKLEEAIALLSASGNERHEDDKEEKGNV